MAKKRKRKMLRREINPEGSNKMIIAVAVGLGLLVAGFLLLVNLGGESGTAKEDRMKSAVSYLEGTEGIIDLAVLPENNRLVIVYDPLDRKDFQAIARFAALRLSHNLKGETVEVVVRRGDADGEKDFQFRARDGALLSGNR